jgi:hypothetical protein
MAAALVAPPTPSLGSLYEAALPQKSAEPGGRVHSEGGSRTTLLIAGGAVVAFAGGLGIGGLRRRSLRRRSAAEPPQPGEAPVPTAETATPAADTTAPAERAAASIAETAAANAAAEAAAARAAAPAASAPRAPAPAPRRATPAAAPRRPRPPALPEDPVFAARVRWPEGTEAAWRAEITWQSGYRRSEFRVLATAPGSKKHTVLATSPEFRNLMKDPADTPRPELTSAVKALMDALVKQGWTPVAPGGRWFNRRFVWNGPAPPPGV